MGHTTVVKAMPGVADALSVTLPLGAGLHRRMVYVVLAEGHDFASVAASIKADAYFVRDETHVMQVESVSTLQDVGHGMNILRKGASGASDNNPAVTAQMMVASARASMRQAAGCYTVLEIPLIDFLPGEREKIIRRLV
jgi:diaminopimelate dehydrogenase